MYATDELVDGMSSEYADVQAYAMRACVLQDAKDAKIVTMIKKLRSSDDIAMGHYIRDFAVAALDLLGAEKYTGDNVTIREIINTRFYSD